MPDSRDKLHRDYQSTGQNPPVPTPDMAIAQWVYDHQQTAGFGTQTLPANPMRYLPLKAPMRTRAYWRSNPTTPICFLIPNNNDCWMSGAAQIALALERVHYVEVARDAVLTMESERLRNLLLSAISHDLRTPLQSLLALSHQLAADP